MEEDANQQHNRKGDQGCLMVRTGWWRAITNHPSTLIYGAIYLVKREGDREEKENGERKINREGGVQKQRAC